MIVTVASCCKGGNMWTKSKE